jgi:GTPase
VGAILADTVGFIRKLPHQLVQAFRATLEETTQASLLLHVIDAHNEQREQLIGHVEEVLAEIDADQIPILEVYNKVDLLPARSAGIERDANGRPSRVWVSAHTGEGIPDLLQAISEMLGDDFIAPCLSLAPDHDQGRLRAKLYQMGVVKSESSEEDGSISLQLRLPRLEFTRLLREEGLDPAPFMTPAELAELMQEHA